MAPLLDNVLKKIQRSSIVNGFLATGLYPFDPDRPDYKSKCLDVDIVSEPNDGLEVLPSVEPTSEPHNKYQCALQVMGEVLGEDKFNDMENTMSYEFMEYYEKILALSKNQPIKIIKLSNDITLQVFDNENEKSDVTIITDSDSSQINPPLLDDTPIPQIPLAESTINLDSSFVPSASQLMDVSIQPFDSNNSVHISDVSSSIISNEKIKNSSAVITPSNSKPKSIKIVQISDISSPSPIISNKKMSKKSDSSSVISTPSNSDPCCSKSIIEVGNPNRPHIFWPGRLTFKNRKTPTEPTPIMISASSYRANYLGKKKKTKKVVPGDWQCIMHILRFPILRR